MNKILEIKFGSHLYGTNTESSDSDFKGIYLPTAKQIILGNYPKTISTIRAKQPFERNTKDDVDIEIFSLDRFVNLLLEGQTVALDMLFAGPHSYANTTSEGIRIIDTLFLNKYELLNKNINAFIGYARQQAAKYGQKGFRVHALRSVLDLLNAWKGNVEKLGECDLEHWVPTCGNEHIKIIELMDKKGITGKYLKVCDKHLAFNLKLKNAIEHVQKRFYEYGKRALLAEKNEGVDWKALSHAVRVSSEAVELLTTGNITFPRPDRELLLKIKLGQMPYQEVSEIIEKGLEDLNAAQIISPLREKPNEEWAENFIYRIYSDIVKEG